MAELAGKDEDQCQRGKENSRPHTASVIPHRPGVSRRVVSRSSVRGWEREGMTPRVNGANGGGLAAKKSARSARGCTAETRHPGGRPGRLTPELADAIAAQIAAGLGPGEAARACGVGERTLRTWRRRAWSPRAVDAPFIDLEKRIRHALAGVAPVEPMPTTWEAAAAALESEHPERWALPGLDDVLAELED